MNVFRGLALLAACFVLTSCVGPTAPPPPAADFVLAPDGDDAHAGSAEQPFATFARAQAAVRERLASATGDVRVLVRGGAYSLSAPIVFTPQDGAPNGRRVTYAAWPGERPVFTGGVKIEGFVAGDDGSWRARVPAELAAGFEHLYVNGKRAVRSRWPDEGAFLLKSVAENPKPEGRNRSGSSTVTMGLAANELAPLAGLDAAALSNVQVIVHHKWDHTRRFIAGLDAAAGTVVTRGQQMKPWNQMSKGCLAYFENVPGSCNAPGEWLLERDGVLVYRPRAGERPETAEVWAPRTALLVAFKGDPAAGRFVSNVTLSGLTFAHADHRTPAGGFEPNQASVSVGAAVQADGAHGVVLSDCVIEHTGAHGVWFRKGCVDCRIERCRISDLGGGALYLGDVRAPARPADATCGNTIDNNILQCGGRYFPSACGLWIGQAASNTVTHNDIGDFFYTGISVGWVWGYAPSTTKANDIGFNHVHHIGQGWMSDMGGIYTLGKSEGTRVHDNWFHHIWSHTYGGWGLYTDEGSSGIVFENNLVHDTKDGSFHQHYGRENIVRNNLLAFSHPFQVAATRIEEHLSFTFERNIVVWNSGAVTKGNWDKARLTTHSNLWWCYASDATNAAAAALARWQKAGREAGSLAADPRFADAGARNFALPADSPARSVGFVPFENRAGVHGNPAWVQTARSTPMPGFERLPDWSR